MPEPWSANSLVQGIISEEQAVPSEQDVDVTEKTELKGRQKWNTFTRRWHSILWLYKTQESSKNRCSSWVQGKFIFMNHLSEHNESSFTPKSACQHRLKCLVAVVARKVM